MTLQHKIDYIKSCLQKHGIDILNKQETEIKPDVPLKILNIPGYSIEVEQNQTKIRVATYISNRTKYKRRIDIEQKDSHIIIFDVNTGANNKIRMVNLYRPFTPISLSEKEQLHYCKLGHTW